MGYCEGQIKGDSDIAGIGVVLAVFINAVIPIILSMVLWVYTMFYLNAGNLGPAYRHPKWIKVVRNLLIMQGDVQLVTGLSIIVASLVNIYRDDETPLYHIFIARALADISLEGHAAAIIHVYPFKHNWKLRTAVFFLVNVLWEWWSLLAIDRFDRWNWETPHCLENNSIVPGDYKVWITISLVWFPVGSVTLYMNLFKNGRAFIEPVERKLFNFTKSVGQGFLEFVRGSSNGLVESLVHFAIILFLALLCIVFWVVVLLIPASRYLGPFQSLLSLVWNAYDVGTVRAANAQIVVANPTYRSTKSFQNNDNPEHDWGFGQVLPFVMLLLPILSALDMVNGEPQQLFLSASAD